MNKILFVSKILIFGIIFTLLLPQEGAAHVNCASEKLYKSPKKALSTEIIQKRLSKISSDVDLRINKEALRKINEYVNLYTSSSEKILGRAMQYFPVFEKELRKRNLPDELKYVAVIESHLLAESTSNSGAAGMWQILKSTGRMLGLQVNGVVDERRDPIKSTNAALDYLESLHKQFGDWTVAIAAYNCGPGSMRKAIRKTGGNSRDFWQIKRNLPKETQNYIPRLVAASYLVNYYYLHNIQPAVPSQDIRFTKSINLTKDMSISKIERQLEMTPGILKQLNPAFRTDLAPKRDIVIPATYYNSFMKMYTPKQYDSVTAKRMKKELESQNKKSNEYATQSFISRDSIRHLEQLVVNFFSKINPLEKRKKYNIPSAMRSNLSFVNA